jgi:rRNA-processing protein FCF1
MRFLLDTNFLLIPGKFRVDIFHELEKFGRPEVFVLDLTMIELRTIIKRGGRDSKHALLALDLLVKKDVGVLEAGSREHTDRVLMRFARKGYTVCTSDAGLLRRLRGDGLRAVTLRNGSYLEEA